MSEIVVDVVMVGAQIKDMTLRGIARATGGYCFHPTHMQESLRIFEAETVLSLRCRERPSKPAPVSTKGGLELLQGGAWDAAGTTTIRKPELLQKPATTPTAALRQMARVPPPAAAAAHQQRRMRRLLREIHAYQRES